MEGWYEVCLGLMISVAFCLVISLWFDVRDVKRTVDRIESVYHTLDLTDRFLRKEKEGKHEGLTAAQNLMVSSALIKALEKPMRQAQFKQLKGDMVSAMKAVNRETGADALEWISKAKW